MIINKLTTTISPSDRDNQLHANLTCPKLFMIRAK
jgi:hypothetical protein